MDIGKLITVAGIAGVGYWLYSSYFAGPAVVPVSTTPPAGLLPPGSGSSLPPGSGGANPPIIPVTTPPSVIAAATSPADRIYAAIVASATGDVNAVNGNLSAYQWNYYLGQQGLNPPDPAGLFSDPAQPISSAVWWAKVAPALTAAGSLSGLGFLAGLGCYVDLYGANRSLYGRATS